MKKRKNKKKIEKTKREDMRMLWKTFQNKQQGNRKLCNCSVYRTVLLKEKSE